MSEIYLAKSEVRKSKLFKQGLPEKYRFTRGSGILDFIRQAGCIPCAPIDGDRE